MLTSKDAAPAVRTQLEGITGATVLDARTIRFDLKERTDDTIFNVGSIPVFSPKWARGPTASRSRSTRSSTSIPITTGPYTIAHRRRAAAHRVRARSELLGPRPRRVEGQFNFDRVVYRYYQDNAISMEAFKAGEFDFLMEYSARRWARQHDGPKWDDGRIVKKEFDTASAWACRRTAQPAPAAVPGPPRARGARLAYDFETINVYKQYKRIDSLFSNSEFAAEGLPSPGELALLEPFRGELPPRCSARRDRTPRTDTDPNALRNNLKQARKLLEEAGWKVDADGVLRNAKGEALRVRVARGRRGARAAARRSCSATWRCSASSSTSALVDFALYRKRLETFDFDMINIKSARLGAAQRGRPQGVARQRGGRRAGLGQLPRRQEQGRRRPDRADGQGEDDGRAARRRPARSTASFMHEHYQVPRPLCAPATACPTGTSSASRRRCPSTTRSPRPSDWPAVGGDGVVGQGRSARRRRRREP